MFLDVVNVLLVFPKFNENSFWNYQATCDLSNARYPAAPLGLITVAALLPKKWDIKLIDRNTENLTHDDLNWADIVMTGGMLPQRIDTIDIINLSHEFGKTVVVGGPDVTSSPSFYDIADFQVLGEAEEIMQDFVTSWLRGDKKGIFQAAMGKTDVTKSPIPRFDLLKLDHYLHVGVQFSRGCPFNCEFCDIIELYGRIPRTKTNQQVISELDTLYNLGYRGHVDFVDDNLIGNKKALRKFIPDLIEWQRKKKYPFEFSTEASINLADDTELLTDLRNANFFAVFVGIESPDPETLILAQKKQNTKRSLEHSIRKIYEAGIFVNAGFIVGFDSENESISEGMIKCIEDTSIPVCMVGLLYALPTTQLWNRLSLEGRIIENDEYEYSGDQCTAGLNFNTNRLREEILNDYLIILKRIYEPSAYFGRVRSLGRMLNRKHRYQMKKGDLRSFIRLIFRIHRTGTGASFNFWRTLIDCALHNPKALPYIVMINALYLHLGPFSKRVINEIERKISVIRK